MIFKTERNKQKFGGNKEARPLKQRKKLRNKANKRKKKQPNTECIIWSNQPISSQHLAAWPHPPAAITRPGSTSLKSWRLSQFCQEKNKANVGKKKEFFILTPILKHVFSCGTWLDGNLLKGQLENWEQQYERSKDTWMYGASLVFVFAVTQLPPWSIFWVKRYR